MVLSDPIIQHFFAKEEMGVPLRLVTLGAEGRYALVWLAAASPIRLLRSFGHKVVQQDIHLQDLIFDEDNPQKIRIHRADIAHSGVSFEVPEQDLHALQQLMKENKP